MSYFNDLILYVVLGIALLAIPVMLTTKGSVLNIRAQGYAKKALDATGGAIIVALSFLIYLLLRYRGKLVAPIVVLGIVLSVFLSIFHFGTSPANAVSRVFSVALGLALSVALLIVGMKLAKMRRSLALRVTGYAAIVLGPAFAVYVILSWWWWLEFSYHD